MPFFCKKYEQGNEQKQKSGLLLLLFGGRKQYVIENQPITRRIRVHVKFGGRVADDVLVILGVVTTKESPKAVTEITVDIAVLVKCSIVAQHHNRRLNNRLIKCRGLAHETFN